MFRDSDIEIHNQEEVHPTEQDVEENVPIGTVPGSNRDRENSKENVPVTRVRANDVSALPALSDKPSSSNARSSRRGTAAVITGSPSKDSLKIKKGTAQLRLNFNRWRKKYAAKNLASKHKTSRKRKAVSSWSESDRD
jgi:hypothetical protein